MTHQNLRLGKCWKLFWATLKDRTAHNWDRGKNIQENCWSKNPCGEGDATNKNVSHFGQWVQAVNGTPGWPNILSASFSCKFSNLIFKVSWAFFAGCVSTKSDWEHFKFIAQDLKRECPMTEAQQPEVTSNEWFLTKLYSIPSFKVM